jgi:hypothetical protein
MSSVKRASAWLTLAALVGPLAGGVALTVHAGALLPSHHAHADHDDAADVDHYVSDVYDHRRDDHDHAHDFQQVWHGHRHDRTTPEHSHPSVFASPPMTVGPAAPRVIPSHGSHVIELAGDARGCPGAARPTARGHADPGPSPPADPPAILRI